MRDLKSKYEGDKRFQKLMDKYKAIKTQEDTQKLMTDANKFIKKREVKKLKKVIFNEQMNEVFDYNERKWNDDKDKDGFMQGKFTVQEIKVVMKSLC